MKSRNNRLKGWRTRREGLCK